MSLVCPPRPHGLVRPICAGGASRGARGLVAGPGGCGSRPDESGGAPDAAARRGPRSRLRNFSDVFSFVR
eukprot:13681384-Alexandrium_andersonii.AAC.1